MRYTLRILSLVSFAIVGGSFAQSEVIFLPMVEPVVWHLARL